MQLQPRYPKPSDSAARSLSTAWYAPHLSYLPCLKRPDVSCTHLLQQRSSCRRFRLQVRLPRLRGTPASTRQDQQYNALSMPVPESLSRSVHPDLMCKPQWRTWVPLARVGD
jgi:hypothetical protein